MQRSSRLPRKPACCQIAAASPVAAPARLRGGLAAGLALCFALLLGGCGTLQSAAPRPAALALAPATQGTLADIARRSTPPGDLSGFRLMPLGAFALDTRMQLIQRAQRSLDLQYYVIENDGTGRRLLRGLRDAATRGVRVRLLVDDLYTTHTQDMLRALAGLPNVEVRLFNPFCCQRESTVGRFSSALFDLSRINHRMHNKLLVADGLMAVAGGRNIADEYFMLNASGNFVDMDAFMMGGVVSQLEVIFDKYWNSDVVYAIQQLVPPQAPPQAPPEQLSARFQRLSSPPGAPPQLPDVDVLGYGPIGYDFAAGRIGLIWAPARAFADRPDKLHAMSSEEAREFSVSKDVRMQIWAAKSELVITSPYMIPGKMGIDAFDNLEKRNVKVTVLTNSLAATDEPLVHTGYARYRVRLLESGVDLYELTPERTRKTKRLGLFGSSFGRLHAKTAVVDRRMVFIGSMNLDPRSDTQNTELGIFVDSPQLAKEMLRIINIGKLQGAYRVRLDKAGDLQWLTMDDDKEIILYTEPEASWWQRVENVLISPFVPEELL